MSYETVTRGAHHIDLTVSDLARASAFFLETLGFVQLDEAPDCAAIFLTDGATIITLRQMEEPLRLAPFVSKNVIGQRDLALKVEGVDALDALNDNMVANDSVDIEFSPERLGRG